MNSSSFSGEWTAKADGKHPLLLQPRVTLSSGFKHFKSQSSNASPQSGLEGDLLDADLTCEGWAVSTAPDLWSSAPWSCSETPAGGQRTFQQPLCPAHGVGWLKPRLLPCKFMITPHSSFFMSRKTIKQHRNKQRAASSSPLAHGKQISGCCSDFSPTRGSPACPTKPPVGHSMRHRGLGQLKSLSSWREQTAAEAV